MALFKRPFRAAEALSTVGLEINQQLGILGANLFFAGGSNPTYASLAATLNTSTNGIDYTYVTNFLINVNGFFMVPLHTVGVLGNFYRLTITGGPEPVITQPIQYEFRNMTGGVSRQDSQGAVSTTVVVPATANRAYVTMIGAGNAASLILGEAKTGAVVQGFVTVTAGNTLYYRTGAAASETSTRIALTSISNMTNFVEAGAAIISAVGIAAEAGSFGLPAYFENGMSSSPPIGGLQNLSTIVPIEFAGYSGNGGYISVYFQQVFVP